MSEVAFEGAVGLRLSDGGGPSQVEGELGQSTGNGGQGREGQQCSWARHVDGGKCLWKGDFECHAENLYSGGSKHAYAR